MEIPSLRQLECFVAAADLLSFRRAAERCFMTQPSLSAQIRQLEERLGVELFERRGRRVLLTAAGEELAPAARRILEDARELVETASSLREPLGGTLRLGVIPTVAPYLLPSLVPRVKARHPRLRLLIREDTTARLVAELEAGRLELLLLALEADLGQAETLPLFPDPFRLVAPRGHPLAARERVTPADLEGEEVLLLEDGHCLRAQTLPLCEQAGALELDDFRATSLGTLVQMVAGGVGVTLVPELALSVEVPPGGELVALPFAGVSPARTIGLAWRRGSPRRRELLLLADTLKGLGTSVAGR